MASNPLAFMKPLSQALRPSYDRKDLLTSHSVVFCHVSDAGQDPVAARRVGVSSFHDDDSNSLSALFNSIPYQGDALSSSHHSQGGTQARIGHEWCYRGGGSRDWYVQCRLVPLFGLYPFHSLLTRHYTYCSTHSPLQSPFACAP